MVISELKPLDDFSLWIKTTNGSIGIFDVKPYLSDEAYLSLNQLSEFMKIKNGGYFVEWDCGADLSADTIEVKMIMIGSHENESLHIREDRKNNYQDSD